MKKIDSYISLCEYITESLPIKAISVDKNYLSFWDTDTIGFFPTIDNSWLSLNGKDIRKILCTKWKDVFGFTKDVKNISSLFLSKSNVSNDFYSLSDREKIKCFILMMFNIFKTAEKIEFEEKIISILENENVQIGYFNNFLKLELKNKNRFTFKKDNLDEQIEKFILGVSNNARVIPIIEE